jgi:hypothetical protein
VQKQKCLLPINVHGDFTFQHSIQNGDAFCIGEEKRCKNVSPISWMHFVEALPLLACRSRLLLAPRSSSSSVPLEATAALGLPVEVGARAASHGGRDGIPRGPEDGRGRGRRR